MSQKFPKPFSGFIDSQTLKRIGVLVQDRPDEFSSGILVTSSGKSHFFGEQNFPALVPCEDSEQCSPHLLFFVRGRTDATQENQYPTFEETSRIIEALFDPHGYWSGVLFFLPGGVYLFRWTLGESKQLNHMNKEGVENKKGFVMSYLTSIVSQFHDPRVADIKSLKPTGFGKALSVLNISVRFFSSSVCSTKGINLIRKRREGSQDGDSWSSSSDEESESNRSFSPFWGEASGTHAPASGSSSTGKILIPSQRCIEYYVCSLLNFPVEWYHFFNNTPLDQVPVEYHPYVSQWQIIQGMVQVTHSFLQACDPRNQNQRDVNALRKWIEDFELTQ